MNVKTYYRYQDYYDLLLLTNPVVDLTAMSTHSENPEWVWQLEGINHTKFTLQSDIDRLVFFL